MRWEITYFSRNHNAIVMSLYCFCMSFLKIMSSNAIKLQAMLSLFPDGNNLKIMLGRSFWSLSGSWSMAVKLFLQDLMEALNQLEQGLKDNIKKLSSFEKYKQEVLLGHLDWSPMHKDPIFWRENITCFEEHDFQVWTLCHYTLSGVTSTRIQLHHYCKIPVLCSSPPATTSLLWLIDLSILFDIYLISFT